MKSKGEQGTNIPKLKQHLFIVQSFRAIDPRNDTI
jgi:hypothetical protein